MGKNAAEFAVCAICMCVFMCMCERVCRVMILSTFAELVPAYLCIFDRFSYPK